MQRAIKEYLVIAAVITATALAFVWCLVADDYEGWKWIEKEWSDNPLVPDSLLQAPAWHVWLWLAVGVWVLAVVAYLGITARRRPSNT